MLCLFNILMSKNTNTIFGKKRSVRSEKKLLSVIIFSGLILLIIITFLSGPRGTLRLLREMQKKETLIQEIKQLESTRTVLDSTKKRLQNDPTYIEKIAREEYNMKREGEKVIKIETEK